MNIRELRVGNFVTIDNPKHPFLLGVMVEIVGIQSDGWADGVRVSNDGDTFGQLLKFVNPIPITPEILASFGFELDEQNGEFLRIKLFGNNKYLSGRLNNYGEFWIVSLNYTVRLKYAHQLQNLYFALTGEELEYKPSK